MNAEQIYQKLITDIIMAVVPSSDI